MNTEYFFLFFGLMFPLVFSPGPANIVFAMSGISQGIKRSIPLIIGVDLVFIIYSLLIGLGLDKVLQLYPSLIFVLQLLGSLYIIYLAYKFLRSNNTKMQSTKKVFTFKDGVLLQTLNPKGWAMILLMFSTLTDSSFNHNEQIIALVIMLAILNISTHFIWVITGNHISKWIENEKTNKILNYFFSASLFIVAVWLLLQLELPV